MSRQFSVEEMSEMRADMARNPGKEGLIRVAQLHDCEPDEVMQALCLDEWPPELKKPSGKYTEETRDAAVNAVLDGMKRSEAARRYGVHPATLALWVKKSVKAEVRPGASQQEEQASAAGQTDPVSAAPGRPETGAAQESVSVPAYEPEPDSGEPAASMPEADVDLTRTLRAGVEGLRAYLRAFRRTGLLDEEELDRLCALRDLSLAFVKGAVYAGREEP